MNANRRLLVRVIAAGVLAVGLLLCAAPNRGVSADGGGLALASRADSDEVVLADFTPRQAASRTTGGSLTTRGQAAGGLGGADSFKGGPGCSIQCITSGIAYARGVDAELVVKTDVPARIWIMVWDDDGYSRVFDSEVKVTEFHGFFDDLEAGTTYQAMATAQDGEGYVDNGYGDFTTLNRHVEISIVQANIEAKPYGGDSFSGYLWLEGAWVDGFSDGPYDLDGDTLWLGINILSLQNVDQYLDLSLQLAQTDESEDLCEATMAPDSPANFSWGCDTWAYATLYDGDNDLDERPADATSWTEHTLERILFLPGGNALPPGFGEALDFTVPVTLHVTYE